jgi:hypothetical protein
LKTDELIQKIEKMKQECVAKSKKATQITQDLATIKAKTNDLNSLEMDDIKHGEIMSKKKSKELNDLMGQVLKKYKFELQQTKSIWVMFLGH